jgi:hypothetical protein
MSPGVVMVTALVLAVAIGLLRRSYLDSTDPARRPVKPPVVLGRRDVFEKPAASAAADPSCKSAA